jgi:opacity protein-like surface antigen
MKNFLVIFCAAFLATISQCYATGLFVGVDALNTDARYRAKNSSSVVGPKNHSTESDNKMGFGVNAGLRFDLLNLLASGEIFYDDLRTSSSGFVDNNNQKNSSDHLELKNRYGIKGNLGFAILPRITPFITYGLTNVQYNVRSAGNSASKSEFTSLYGVGILFDLPLGITAKASYDYQQFHMNYAGNGKSRTQLGVAKLGLIYNF